MGAFSNIPARAAAIESRSGSSDLVVTEAAKKNRVAVVAKIAAVAVALVFFLVAGRRLGFFVPRFVEWVDGLGIWGPAVFIAGYAIATVAFVPGSALTLAAGAVFGLARGTAYAFAGAMIGLSAAFLVARYAARRRVESRLASRPRFRAVDRAVGRDGWKIVALLRLSPVFPFNLLNYALGLTGIRFVHYVLASIAILPGTLLYVYYGTVAGEVVKATAGSSTRGAVGWTVLVIGLLATVAVTIFVAKKARKALEDAELGGPTSPLPSGEGTKG